MDVLTKQCSKCSETKPLEAFPRLSRNKDGRHSACLVCHRAENLAFYHKNKERINPERNVKRRGTGSHFASALRTKYGMTLEQYDELSKEQNHRCAICCQPETQRDARYGQTLRLAVDHDHETGRIRGLLCSACNVAIGKMKDDPALLRRAAFYLTNQELAPIEDDDSIRRSDASRNRA